MIDTSKPKCSGCLACYNACPENAVRMAVKDGFYKSIIESDQCIQCGICNEVCALEKHQSNDTHKPIKIFGGITKEKKNWLRCASGGAFYDICRSFGDNQTYVFGTIMDEALVTKVECTQGVESAAVFSDSKYVQSFVGRKFRECKRLLQECNKVIFSGTPCQIYALRKYLNKEYDNLLCIDLVCHGVAGPEVFGAHIKYLEKKYKSKVIRFQFRRKTKLLGRYIDYTPRVFFENGKHKNLFNDEFMRLFLSGICLNVSCVSCPFKSNERSGDISIGDLKKAWILLPGTARKSRYSLISINTEKGEKVSKALSQYMTLYPLDSEMINRYNQSFCKPEEENHKRANFMVDFTSHKDDVKVLYDKYLKNAKLNYGSYFIPNWLKRLRKR